MRERGTTPRPPPLKRRGSRKRDAIAPFYSEEGVGGGGPTREKEGGRGDGNTNKRVADAIRFATNRLSATSDTARFDAELIMAHALRTTRSEMLLKRMHDAVPGSFAALVERRARREPVAHIVGHQEFYGLDLRVTPDTLIPRGDSETLIEAMREYFGEAPPGRILDMGTGTGALLLAALSLWPDAEGVGVDASPAALEVACENATRLGMADRAQMLAKSWHDAGWSDDLGRFDLILCNPPYVETDAALDPDVRDYEPAEALFAGPEGLDDYRAIIPQLGKLLLPGGAAILEIGATQEEAVTAIVGESGFAAALRRDLAGRPRALICT